ncbi:MAG: hypothetical protein M9900_00340 [Flavobacteriales bacterium]|nr:hypothetical protein [Flavobacteriales bacterium]
MASSDSTALVQGIHSTAPWIADQVLALHATRDPAQRKILADELADRTDALTRRWRQVFPEEDDGWVMASTYNGLAAVFDAGTPGAGAPYRAIAAAFENSDPAPFRPDMYHALQAISDRAWSLARAKNAKRAERLLGKLDAANMDLVVAL